MIRIKRFIRPVGLSVSVLALGQTPMDARFRPPMGWNSWNKFAEQVTDADICATADILVNAGYVYVNIDDTWEAMGQGNIHANSKLPDMKALADYVHSKGLKLRSLENISIHKLIPGSRWPRHRVRNDILRAG